MCIRDSLRDIPKFQEQLLRDGWSAPGWYNEGLLDQPVGLIGFGAVARHTVKMLAPFHTCLLYTSSKPSFRADFGSSIAGLIAFVKTLPEIAAS